MGLKGSYEREMQVKTSAGNTNGKGEIFYADSTENDPKTDGIRK